MALTRKEKAGLEGILSNLKRVEKLIKSEDIHVCMQTKGQPYGTDYVNKENVGLCSMNKHVGTDLCYLYNSIRQLHSLLNPEPITEKND